jgi:putative membrane protein
MSSEHRLHPFSILFAFLAQIRVFIVPGLLVYFGVGSRESDWWQPWMMIFVLPSAAVAVVRYLTYRYRYEPSELVIQTGLLFRKERHIPYARIQNIDAEQNILHRLLNVVEITIETGSGQAAEATMSVLPFDALSEMRQRVFAERHAVAVDAPGVTPADVEAHRVGAPAPLLQLGIRELLLCGFIENRGAVLIAAGFGLAWELGLIDRFVAPLVGETEIGRGVLRDMARGVVSNAALLWSRIGLTLAAFVGLLLLIRVLSMAWAVIRLYGFRLTLVDGDARTEFGLLTRVAMTIPLRRVQALTVREGPLHRWFTRVAVKVDTAGGHGGEQNQSSEREYLAPILPTGARDAFVGTIVGVGLAGVDWRPVAAGAFRREVKGWLAPAVLVCLALAFYVGWPALALSPLLMAWAIIGARQTVKHLGWALTEDAVLFRSGWLWRRIVVMRFAKIQAVTRYQSPFDRRTRMTRVHVDAAGASMGSVVNIPYVPADEAEALYTRLSQEAAQRQFTW